MALFRANLEMEKVAEIEFEIDDDAVIAEDELQELAWSHVSAADWEELYSNTRVWKVVD